MPYIVVTHDHGFAKEWQFDSLDMLTIGRAPTNDIVLLDESAKISRYHACIVRAEPNTGCYFLRDLSSLHLTKVGGKPVTQRTLASGDIIEIGSYRLIYTEEVSHSASEAGDNEELLTVLDESPSGDSFGRSRQVQGQTTRPTTPSQRLEGVALSASQQELVTEYLRKAQRTTDLQSFFSSVIESIANVFAAPSAFVGVFAVETAKGYKPISVHGLNPRKGERLHITNRNFLDELRKCHPVVEAKVLLVPMHFQGRVAGFLCLGWKTRTAPIPKSEVDALSLLGRLVAVVGAQQQEDDPSIRDASITHKALAWSSTFVGRSECAQALRSELIAAASTDDNVLLYGPTGSGKEVAATMVHQHSSVYGRGPFLAISCAQLQETLVESELFGYAPKSGIAGADPNGKPGFFELAGGGVLFLDEVHTLSLAIQAKLLRVLEEKMVWRLQSRLPVQVNVKVIAATNEDLPHLMGKGAFRNDLFYRFSRRVYVPALGERSEDVSLLLHYFLDRFASEEHRPPLSISRQALHKLAGYGWPGNIRELRDWAKQAVALKREVWFSWDLPNEVPDPSSMATGQGTRPKTMKEVERAHIVEALTFTRGNKSEAARVLGFNSRQTLLNKMDEYQIPREFAAVSEGEEANARPGDR